MKIVENNVTLITLTYLFCFRLTLQVRESLEKFEDTKEDTEVSKNQRRTQCNGQGEKEKKSHNDT
jgi:hypothetical protein